MTTKRKVDKENVPWVLREGVRNERTITFLEEDETTPKDLTGYSYYCHIREREGGRLIATVSIDETDLATGVIVLSVAKTVEFGDRAARYDLLQEEDADTTNLLFILGGDVEVKAAITEV